MSGHYAVACDYVRSVRYLPGWWLLDDWQDATDGPIPVKVSCSFKMRFESQSQELDCYWFAFVAIEGGVCRQNRLD